MYFSAAISDVPSEILKCQKRIIEELEAMGHVVISEHRRGKNKDVLGSQTEDEAMAVQRKMSKWRKQADLVVVEASVPSFGVGQEISEAVVDNKQVIILYLKGMKPHILINRGQEDLYLAEYKGENVREVLKEYIEFARSRSDTRFNFFISPAIGAYLDWVSRGQRIPRAVYLRKLIEKEMKNNEEYDK